MSASRLLAWENWLVASVKRVVLPAPRPFFETLFGDPEETQTTAEQKAQQALAESLPEDVRRMFRYAALFDQMKHGEAMLMLPFELEIK